MFHNFYFGRGPCFGWHDHQICILNKILILTANYICSFFTHIEAKYILTQKVPVHEIVFVSMVTCTIEVKSSDCHFCMKEYSFVCVTVQFDLIFFNSAWYKNALNTPGVIYHFCRIKSLKWLDLNALKFFATNNFPNCPTLH